MENTLIWAPVCYKKTSQIVKNQFAAIKKYYEYHVYNLQKHFLLFFFNTSLVSLIL